MKPFIIAILLFVSFHSFSQDGDKHERIKALKVAYLTEQLQLSKTEAQQFWPIYNAFDEQEQSFRKERYSKRKKTDVESLSEQEAKKVIEDMISTENEKHELRENFIKDLQKILPAKKIIKLRIAEDEFNKKMFEEYKKRRDSKKNKS